jgi:hypothetical protein
MAMLVYEERLAMPMIDLLFEELTELKIMNNNKVDHPRKKSKDLADAVCGAIFGAISHTPRDLNLEVDIHTFRDRPKESLDGNASGMVKYKSMPTEVKEYLARFDLI